VHRFPARGYPLSSHVTEYRRRRKDEKEDKKYLLYLNISHIKQPCFDRIPQPDIEDINRISYGYKGLLYTGYHELSPLGPVRIPLITPETPAFSLREKKKSLVLFAGVNYTVFPSVRPLRYFIVKISVDLQPWDRQGRTSNLHAVITEELKIITK